MSRDIRFREAKQHSIVKPWEKIDYLQEPPEVKPKKLYLVKRELKDIQGSDK